MIPTAFLEKDNNLRKLSLNKLVNLGWTNTFFQYSFTKKLKLPTVNQLINIILLRYISFEIPIKSVHISQPSFS